MGASLPPHGSEPSGPAAASGPSRPDEAAGTGHGGPPCLGQRLAAALEELWIALFAWVPTPLGLALRLLAWRWLFARCGSVRFGTGLTLAGCPHMRLGDNVRLGRGCFVTATDGTLVLHHDVALSPCVHVGADAGRIEIGAHTAVGPGTVIRAANHRIARQDVPIMCQGHVPGQIVIEEDVWIGANCVVTPDVRIGRGAVVGAGAVVTRNVAPFTIVGGVPAKVIGMRGIAAPQSGPAHPQE
ncbi:acyltransferase [Desulfovibrio legallii]|uniref:Galactoside O-acetyltransferase n=1 Tax=Desulfovibrio legallii TaxID=571438 RepID=A0A1G7QPT7_9BACT|nr:acyltransferase [Desulfovibrio legallii]SDG00551.1 galactoside O-acetyltransferase [Desulfovibrio legallii]